MQKLYRWTKNYQYRDTPTLLLIFLLLQLHTSIGVRIQPWWRNWSSGSNPVNGNWAWLPGLLYPPERRRWVVRASSNSHPFLPSCDVTGGERATAAPTRLTTSEAQARLFLSWTPRLTLDHINQRNFDQHHLLARVIAQSWCDFRWREWQRGSPYILALLHSDEPFPPMTVAFHSFWTNSGSECSKSQWKRLGPSSGAFDGRAIPEGKQ